MGLEEFEKQLAEGKRQARGSRSPERKSHHNRRDEERSHRHKHHDRSRHHRSHHHDERRDRDENDEDSRRSRHHHHSKHKRERSRSPRTRDTDAERKRRRRDRSPAAEDHSGLNLKKTEDEEDAEDEWVEKDSSLLEPTNQSEAQQTSQQPSRDAWMQPPSAIEIEHVQQRRGKRNASPRSQFVPASTEASAPNTTAATQLAQDFDSDDHDGDAAASAAQTQFAPREQSVTYTFGDAGSEWRLTKLRGVQREAKESGRPVDEVAERRYGDLRLFDDAREEEREMDRRRTYGADYVGLEKPSGEFFEERKRKMREEDEKQRRRNDEEAESRRKGEVSSTPAPNLSVPENGTTMETTPALDATALNKLKAQLLKARLRKAPDLAQLEAAYMRAEEATAHANAQRPMEEGGNIVLDAAANRMLAGGRGSEVRTLSGKRAQERGTVEENEDMTIEEMVRAEKRTAHENSSRAMAERIAKDSHFVDNVDYLDERASNLARHVPKSDLHLRSSALDAHARSQRSLRRCPLCTDEANQRPPTAPIVSLATRTYLTLPTLPELTPLGALIVPITHHPNLRSCDEDEWEEVRNFMKSLLRFYASRDQGVIFYEDAARRDRHAALVAVPLSHGLEASAPAYFKQALLTQANAWSQHVPIIDTLALAEEKHGKAAFRRAIVREAPYFHVWFSLDGGLGHVVEEEGDGGGMDGYEKEDDDDDDERSGGKGRKARAVRGWPRGDGFAREVLGGMLNVGMEVIRKQGRWAGPGDVAEKKRVELFRRSWGPFDWTAALVEADGGS